MAGVSEQHSALRVDGYVRVSQVGMRRGERFISPDVQREAIERWADGRGARVLRIFVELDESGGRADRPLLEAAITRVEDGISQGIVVAKLDRFGRSLVAGLSAIDRIERAGGTFVAVHDSLDLTTEAGRLVLRIMLSLAEFELRRVRATWEVATARAIARGVYTGSWVPVGYRKTRGGRLRPHPRTGPLVTEAFRRRAAGESIRAVGEFLEAHKVKTGAGNPGWAPATTARVLSNRVYLGELRRSPHVNERAHPPLIDAATWEVAQRPRQRTAPVGRPPVLLRGLVRCASCGRRMSSVPQPRRDSQYRIYVCRGVSAAGRCPAPASMASSALEGCVEDIALDLLRRRRRPPRVELDRSEAALKAAQRAMEAYRDTDRVLTTLGASAYADGLAARVSRVRDARLDIADARAKHALHNLPSIGELEDRWPDMDVLARHDVIAKAIDCVFIARGRSRVDERVTVCPAGSGPRGLPQAGDKRTRSRAYGPRRGWITPSDPEKRPAPWSPSRLERELRAFLNGRTIWPHQDVFAAAGRARLYHQVGLQGGPEVWTHQLGLRPAHQPSSDWTDDRIRDALRVYLADKDFFPTIRQFKTDGLHSLRAAITNRGGIRRWAAEMDIQRPHHNNGPAGHWNEHTIRAALLELCAGRDTYPSRREFHVAGLAGLQQATYRIKGPNAWATELDLRRQDGRSPGDAG